MKKIQEQKKKLTSLEDEISMISEKFALHVEAQAKAMEDEKVRQHKNVAERRRRALARRKKARKDGKKERTSLESRSGNQSSADTLAIDAKLRTVCEEVNQSLDRARQRQALGKPWEEQCRSLIADIKQVLQHNNNYATYGPSRISAPNLVAGRPRLNLGVPLVNGTNDIDNSTKHKILMRKLEELDGKESKTITRPPLPP